MGARRIDGVVAPGRTPRAMITDLCAYARRSGGVAHVGSVSLPP